MLLLLLLLLMLMLMLVPAASLTRRRMDPTWPATPMVPARGMMRLGFSLGLSGFRREVRLAPGLAEQTHTEG